LYGDGRIVFQYKKLARLPSIVSVGVQNSTSDYQELGCGADLALHDKLAIELRPQPSTAYWLTVDRTSGTIAPAGKQNVTASLGWVRTGAKALSGRIEITSNDPIRSRILLPIQATMRPTPYEFMLPLVDMSTGWLSG
jgi:hypothetical protein